MFRNYLKIAWRNLIKQKVFSFINIFGLATGLTCFLLIALYLTDELTFDAFHKNAGALYRVVEQTTNAAGKESGVTSVAYNISASAQQQLPEVAGASRYAVLGRVNVSNDENKNVFYEDLTVANDSFLQLFDFTLLQGNRQALTAPHSVVITEEAALKIFGKKEVLGKTIRSETDSLPNIITAVVKIPGNSSIRFNLLFSEATLLTRSNFRNFTAADWTSGTFTTYLQLKEGQMPQQVANKITATVMHNRKADAGRQSRFQLQPLRDIHFYPSGRESEESGSNTMHLYIFGIVALFVLFIACINYMNLTTARFTNRSKEIAVRKVAGAVRNNLILQFLTEALLVTLLALLLALAAVQLLLPAFNAFTEKSLTLNLHTDYRIWLGVLLITVFAGLMAGTYPALFQSGLKPLLLLKNKIRLTGGHLSLRRALVIFQFSLSIVMMVATLVVYRQLQYVDKKDMGFNKEQMVVIDINSGAVRRSATTIKNEYAKLAAVKSVTVTSRVPGEWKSIPRVKVKSPDARTPQGADMFYVGADDRFLQTFEVPLQSGRNFSGNNSDSLSVMLNATAAKELGITQASDQLVEIPAVNFGGTEEALNNPLRVRVIGIVKDFNFQSLREKIAPMVIGNSLLPIHNIDYFTAKVSTANMHQTLAQMENILHSIDPGHLFEYNFLDKQWDLFYREDKKREIIFLCMACMTILIACLGLFGLATYAAEQRIKEIGIRKVLGASTSGIVAMLSKDFLKLVLMATVIAFPLAGWAMHKWLQDFAYRTSLSWWVFLLAGGAALLIALCTVSFQAIRAAVMNPVKSLRSE